MASTLKMFDSEPIRVPRSATAYRENGQLDSKPLSDWRSVDAYVLLGDPGAGKSWSFDDESAACGGLLLAARDIVAGIVGTSVGAQTVFIDALDEVRAGTSDGRVPFDAIRNWLVCAGHPRFRLSCREADWLGQNDQRRLESVAPGKRVEVLHLDPLTRDEKLAVLRNRPDEVPDLEAFWGQAEQHGLIALFDNPLLLDLTIKAVVAVGGWSVIGNRHDIYRAASRQLATETSDEHLAVNPLGPGDIERLLDDAGLLCAVLLLSNKQSWSLQSKESSESVTVYALPQAFPVCNAPAALSSKIFSTVAGQSTPRHRSIAEYLAAKALAKRLNEGLPLGRLLSLIQGFDGRPVDPLRGLLAWLVVHHRRDRERLIALDPLGVVLNGDVASLSTSERLSVLEALSEAAHQDYGFRRNAWVTHPFGALATVDMASTLDDLLRAPKRDDGHQAFIDCVLDALCHGECMPQLSEVLAGWVEDGSAWFSNRMAAYKAWSRHTDQPGKAREWLDRIAAGTLSDQDDRLTGAMLTDLYPEYLGPKEVFKYLRTPQRRDSIPAYPRFWRDELLRKARSPQDFADLADSWVELRPLSDQEVMNHETRQLGAKVLAAALVHAGDGVSTERLYNWLGICLDQFGFSPLREETGQEVAAWLEARSHRIKEAAELGYRSIPSVDEKPRLFWRVEQRLHGARLPRDFMHWLLDLAARTGDEDLARYCFGQAAWAAIEVPPNFDAPSLEEVEQWVGAHSSKWANANDWLQEAWTSDLKSWRGDEHRRQQKQKAKVMHSQEERKLNLQPHVEALAAGNAGVGLLHDLASAHEERISYIRGETAVERVRDFLVADEATAIAAIDELENVLDRTDLPSVDDILDTDLKGKFHFIRLPALLAATRVFERSPESIGDWPDDLAQRLVAFYLTDGTGDLPAWYRRLVAKRPDLVAPILMAYATPRLRRKSNHLISGLWGLSRETDHQCLTRLVLPDLLGRFPVRASEANRRELNRSLLAALHLLDVSEARRIVRHKLAEPGLDSAQRICWLVAALPYNADAVEQLALWVGNNERRAVALGVALDAQGSLSRTVQTLHPSAVRRLIEVLAPITPRRFGSRAGFVTVADTREQTLRSLFDFLSSNTSVTAREELRALGESRRLGAWHEIVDFSIRTQQSAMREALFKPVDPAAAALMIANQAPANAADLQALVIQHLGDIEKHLRGADTNSVGQFWQGNGATTKPQNENDCRDRLLDQLRNRLSPLNIDVGREASTAQDTRADMRAEFMRDGERIAIPIELKKENNDKLWTAWRNQLQMFYTIDPGAGGYGLYLILWFGVRPRANPEGVKPRDASHMRQLIIERIPESERHRLEVQVLDLSLPARPGR